MSFTTITELLQVATERHAERTAISDGVVSRSYGELASRVEDWAGELARLGVRRGDRVALWLSNRPEWIEVAFAVARLAAVLVPLNPRYQPGEVGYILRHSGAKVLFVEASAKYRYYQRLVEAFPGLGGATLPGPEFPELNSVISLSGNSEPPRSELVPDERSYAEDTAMLLYTSGTTADPKAVVRTNRNLVPHARDLASRLGLGPEDAVSWAFPLCGTTGLMTALATVAASAKGIVATALNPEALGPLLIGENCSVLLGADAVLGGLAEWSVESGLGFPRLRAGVVAIFGGGDPAGVVRRLDHAFGVPFVQPYGLSEANAFVLMGHFDDPVELRCRPGGTPLSDLEVALMAGEAKSADEGIRGEILVRGASVMPGYADDSEASGVALDRDGWLHTGDLGCKVRDRIYFEGRLKDMLKVHGFNVSPREVEEVIEKHPAVAVAQVVGAYDSDGEVPIAFVTANPGATPSEADLVTLCRQHLAAFKVPRRIVVVDAFPVIEGPQGNKIQRSRLREMAAEVLSKAPSASSVLPSRRVSP